MSEKLSQAELAAFFGQHMPMEAVELMFNPENGSLTIGEVRTRLAEIAERHLAGIEAQKTVRRELLLRHLQAHRNGAEAERQRLFDLIEHFDREFPEAAAAAEQEAEGKQPTRV